MPRQAIVTKYLGPTDSKGSRTKAIADAGTLTVPYDHALNAPENHEQAALALAVKLAWLDGAGSDLEIFRRQYAQGGIAIPGYGYAFVDCTEVIETFKRGL